MASVPYYLMSLSSLSAPATIAEIHKRAVELYGDAIKGDRGSVRSSIERYILMGRVCKMDDDRYWLTDKDPNPVVELTRKLREAEEKVVALKQRIMELELKRQ